MKGEVQMPGELVHFDIPVDDVEKMTAFYRNVMGWTVEPYAGDFPDYWRLAPEPDREGALEGGLGKKQMPEQGPMNYYTAEGGLEAFNQRVKDNGGMVMMEKMPVKGFGWMSVCMDPEGNAFGGWVDDPNAA